MKSLSCQLYRLFFKGRNKEPWDKLSFFVVVSFSASGTHFTIELWALNPPPWSKWPPFWQENKFECNFLNENDRIPIRISLTFVPKSPIDNTPALVQVMAWRRTADKPLSEPMLNQFTDTYMRHWGQMSWSKHPENTLLLKSCLQWPNELTNFTHLTKVLLLEHGQNLIGFDRIFIM